MRAKGEFTKQYRRLNPEQKSAVDAIEGPVMVIAGPGTGKTQILALRIAQILTKTDTPPESILALTFTESGVAAMRSRLLAIIGATAYRIPLYTFHGFANMVIMRHPDQFPRVIGSEPILDTERVLIMRSLLETLPLRHLRPFGDPYYYLKIALGAISDCKREAYDPDMFDALCRKEEEVFEAIPDRYHEKGPYRGKLKGVYESRKKKLEKNRELGVVYRAYEAALQKAKKYDYDDMLLEVVGALTKNEALLREVAETYLYILADEHQDANRGQNLLLTLLASVGGEAPNLFVVGDEKQAIFRFQGASLDTFIQFKKQYQTALIIPLTRNYRSGQAILDAAFSLIGQNTREQLQIPLSAEKESSTHPVRLCAFTTPSHEHSVLAKEIGELVRGGVAPGEIAILARTHRDAERFVPFLRKEGVRVFLQSDRNAFDEPYLAFFMALLSATKDIGYDTALAPVLHGAPFNLAPLDVFRFFAHSKKTKTPLWTLLKSRTFLHHAGIEEADRFLKVYQLCASWHARLGRESLLTLCERIWEESGLLDCVLEDARREEILPAFRAFFGGVADLLSRNHHATLADLLEWVQLLKEHELPLPAIQHSGSGDAVKLMTAHKAKGLEFEVVYLVGALDGVWGKRRVANHFFLPEVLGEGTDLDDERRLFYVALTRAKKKITISWSNTNEQGRDTFPSVFVEELDSRLTRSEDMTPQEDALPKDAFVAGPQTREPAHALKLFFQELFLEQGFTVTGLSNYLECPWKYVYVTLLRIPKTQDKTLLYGTAVHETLRLLFERFRKGKPLTERELKKRFRDIAETFPFSDRELKEVVPRGSEALSGWYRARKGTFTKEGFSEFAIVVPYQVSGRETTLRGTLDRVDLHPEHVVVTDYKTGRPKSRKEIAGETQTRNSTYLRQLLFYRILLDRYEDGRYRMTEGVIDFIEPDQKGRYREERFQIPESDVTQLEKEVSRVATEIFEVSFWNSTCEDPQCMYCRLRARLAPTDGATDNRGLNRGKASS